MVLTRSTPCFLCQAAGYNISNKVVETIEEHIMDASYVPDQGNCDFSRYSNYRCVGGIIIKNREFLSRSTAHIHPDVVCSSCLQEPRISALVSYTLTRGI